MKRTIFLLALAIVTSAAFAQKGKVTTAQSLKEAGKIKEAFETIEKTVDEANPKSAKTIPWAKTWEVRGEIYQAIAVLKQYVHHYLALPAIPL